MLTQDILVFYYDVTKAPAYSIDIANSTALSLSSVTEKAALVEQMNTQITSSSNDQAAAISEIKHRLNAITSVVQNNTATAEESASISEELSAQAEKMYEEIIKYKI